MRAIIAAILIALAIGDSCLADQLAQFTVVGNVIPGSLTGTPGDAARGRSIVLNRAVGLCLLCHSGPFPEERFQGNLAPDLKGTGARWSVEQLRCAWSTVESSTPTQSCRPIMRLMDSTGWRRPTPASRY